MNPFFIHFSFGQLLQFILWLNQVASLALYLNLKSSNALHIERVVGRPVEGIELHRVVGGTTGPRFSQLHVDSPKKLS